MSGLKVKFWTGWLTSENMQSPEWLQKWISKAEEAEKDNCELVVFKIPKDKYKNTSNSVEAIEKLLQNKFKEKP